MPGKLRLVLPHGLLLAATAFLYWAATRIAANTGAGRIGPDAWPKAILVFMKTDLRNLVTAQEAFYFDNSDYAGSTTAGAQVNALGGAGKITFLPSTGNVLVLTYVSNTGYKAVMTNPVLVAGLLNCGVYVGAAANSPNAAVTQEGAPACW